jgi:hypothetical protein
VRARGSIYPPGVTISSSSVPADVLAGIDRQGDARREAAAAMAAADLTVLAFDVDGTLSPITDDAQNTTLAPEAVAALRSLATLPHVQVVLISGRPAAYLQQLLERLDLASLHLPILGVYGRDTLVPGPDGSLLARTHPLVPAADAALAEFEPLFQEALRRTSPVGANVEFSTDPRRQDELDPPIVIERKPGMYVFHYGFGGGDETALSAALGSPEVVALMERLGLHAGPASGAREVDGLPPGATDKGQALLDYLRSLPQVAADPAAKIAVLGFGDDAGDRPAKEMIRRLAEEGSIAYGAFHAVHSAPDGRREGTPPDVYGSGTRAVFARPGDLGTWLDVLASEVRTTLAARHAATAHRVAASHEGSALARPRGSAGPTVPGPARPGSAAGPRP